MQKIDWTDLEKRAAVNDLNTKDIELIILTLNYLLETNDIRVIYGRYSINITSSKFPKSFVTLSPSGLIRQFKLLYDEYSAHWQDQTEDNFNARCFRHMLRDIGSYASVRFYSDGSGCFYTQDGSTVYNFDCFARMIEVAKDLTKQK